MRSATAAIADGRRQSAAKGACVVIQGTDDLLTRIGEVAQKLGAIHQAMGETLVAVAGKDGRELDARELRAFGHGLVSLAGDLTLLGVEMALRADELD